MTELEVAGTSPSFVALLLLVSEIANILPVCMIRVRGCFHITKFHLLVSEIAKCIA